MGSAQTPLEHGKGRSGRAWLKAVSAEKKPKNAHRESCDFSFIGQLNEDYSPETASRIALRDFSKEKGRGRSMYM